METNLDNWEGFLGSNFLKANDVRETDVYVVIGVEIDTENNRPMLILEREGMNYKWTLNVTNATFVKNSNIPSPKALIGKKLSFKKNPTPKGTGLLIINIG